MDTEISNITVKMSIPIHVLFFKSMVDDKTRIDLIDKKKIILAIVFSF